VNAPASPAAAAPRRLGAAAMALRIALVSLPPAFVALWPVVPALQPAVVELRGMATPQRDCVGPFCGERARIGERTLACRVSLVGLPDDCRLRGAGGRGLPSEALAPGVPVVARYAELPTLRSLLGLAPREAVLLRLQQGEQLMLRRSLQSQAWAMLYGDWTFHAVYWPLVGLLMWRWPSTRLGRRVWASITWTRPPPS
jgi:hypothetical protein